MLRNSGIARINIDICVLLFTLTLKAIQKLMHEIVFIMHVGMRNNAEVCVSLLHNK